MLVSGEYRYNLYFAAFSSKKVAKTTYSVHEILGTLFAIKFCDFQKFAKLKWRENLVARKLSGYTTQ